jgi:hypothetical protein
LDDLLFQFGLTDIQTDGKNLKRLLIIKKEDPNFIYFPQIIIKAFKFNLIFVDLLNILRVKYDLIFLPTLSLLLNNISEELQRIKGSSSNLIKQINEKTKDKINMNNLTNLESNRYEDVLPNNEHLLEFIKKLRKVDFENRENEIKCFLRESNKIDLEMKSILELFHRIEPIIMESAKSAWWIKISSLQKRIDASSIYQRILIYQYIILDLENPREKIDPKKVRENFNSFPVISKFFTENWLKRALNNNLTHPLIYWLNALTNQDLNDNLSKQNGLY